MILNHFQEMAPFAPLTNCFGSLLSCSNGLNPYFETKEWHTCRERNCEWRGDRKGRVIRTSFVEWRRATEALREHRSAVGGAGVHRRLLYNGAIN